MTPFHGSFHWSSTRAAPTGEGEEVPRVGASDLSSFIVHLTPSGRRRLPVPTPLRVLCPVNLFPLSLRHCAAFNSELPDH